LSFFIFSVQYLSISFSGLQELGLQILQTPEISCKMCMLMLPSDFFWKEVSQLGTMTQRSSVLCAEHQIFRNIILYFVDCQPI
jgi:hypothetical protein